MEYRVEFIDPARVETVAQRTLLPWLSQPNAPQERLVEWLQGFGLSIATEKEPFEWLLAGLPRGAQRGAAAGELAQRLADLLETRPDEQRPGRFPERLLYNALELAAGLNRAEILCEPLDAMHRRGRLEGAWLGSELRGALVPALIRNQRDDRWQPLWTSLLAGQTPLPGGPYDGFRGVLWMRSASGEVPVVEALGEALKAMAEYLKVTYPREDRSRFGELLHQSVRTYEDPAWGERFIRLADRHRWPRWAVSCLPGVETTADDGQTKARFVDQIVARCLPPRPGRLEQAYCEGAFLLVTASDAEMQPLESFVAELETPRLANLALRYSEVRAIQQHTATYHRVQLKRRVARSAPEETRLEAAIRVATSLNPVAAHANPRARP